MIKLPDGAINASPAIHKAWVDLNGNLDNIYGSYHGSKYVSLCIEDTLGFRLGTYHFTTASPRDRVFSVVCKVSEFRAYCETMRGLPTAPIEPSGFPPVGYTLKFTHDHVGDFKYLHSEKYGWEHGDNLEIIHTTENQHGEPIVIVLNTQSDVLTTAVIDDPLFFDTRTEREKEIHSVMIGWGHESNDLHANNVVYATIQQMLEMGYSK